MATIVDALTDAAQALRDAVAAVLGLRTDIETKIAQNTASVTAIIQQFVARPLYTFVSVDPVNGNDANDGSTPAVPKRTLDAALASVGSQGVCILLFADDVIRRRHLINTNIQIFGAQYANNVSGYIQFNRNISFLGTAINSPFVDGSTASSGITFGAGSIQTSNVVFILPDVPAGLGTRPHIVSSASVNVQCASVTITVGSQAAAALFGSFNSGRLIVTISPVLGPGAAGHVFDGIAAGGDPNTLWSYSTNLKSA